MKKNVSVRITTCRQWLKYHFSTLKMSDFLILSWGGWLMRTKQLITAIGAKIWAHLESKMAKKVTFIPATSIPTQFFWKEKFLRAIVSSLLSKLKDKLTGLHKTLQKFTFYWNLLLYQQMKETYRLKVLPWYTKVVEPNCSKYLKNW